MKSIIQIVRALLGTILITLLLILLTLSPILLAISNVITNKEVVGGIIEKSGIYNDIAINLQDNIFEQLKESGLKSKEISQISSKIKSTISPQYIQTNGENILTGVYNWLEGRSDTVTFESTSLNISPILKDLLPKEQLQNQDFIKLLDNLKPCTPTQLKQFEKTGGFTSPDQFCLPPNFDLLNISQEQYDKQLNTDVNIESPLKLPTISQQDTNTIKFVYQLAQNGEIILGISILVLILLYLLIAPSTYAKSYILGATVIINGVVTYLVWKSELLLSRGNQFISDSINNSDTIIENKTVIAILDQILEKLTENVLIYSIYIVILGVLILVTTFIIKAINNRKSNS